MFIFHRIRTHCIEEPCAFLAFLGGWGMHTHWSSLTASVRPIYLRQFIAGTCHVPNLTPVLCRTPLAALVVHTLPRPRSHTYYIRHVNKHTGPRWKTRRETLAQRVCPPRVFPQSKLIRHKSCIGVRHGHTGKIFPLFECNIKGVRQANSPPPPRPSVRPTVCACVRAQTIVARPKTRWCKYE